MVVPDDMSKHLENRLVDIFAFTAYILGMFTAAAIFGWQIFHWLRSSIWIPIPTHEAFVYLGIDLTSVYMPDDWKGLAKVARWLLDTPLAIGAPTILVTAVHLLITFISDLRSFISDTSPRKAEANRRSAG